MNLDLLFSSFMHEIGKATSEMEVYKALLNSVKSVLNYEKALVMKEDKIVYYEPEMLDIQKFEDYIAWIKQRLLPAFFSEEDKFIGIIPIVKQNKLLGVILLLTKNEPNNEILNLLQTFAFLTGVTVENLILVDQIKKSEKFMSDVLNSINEGIFVLNENGRIEFLNDFAKEILDSAPHINEFLKSAINDERKILTKEFNNHYYTIVKVKFNFSNETKYVVTFNNVTYEIELEKLKQLDKMKTEFVANISHELRTPLTAIKAYTETLLNMEVDRESQREFLETVYEQSERLESLLNDLLDFTLIESGTMELEYSEFDLCELIKEVVENLKQLAEKYKVKINVSCESISISADKRRIKQAIHNLVDNSIKFSDKSKEERYVNISVEKKEENLSIIIEDNGIGISQEDKEKIFEKFYRGDRSLTYEVPGTGLGLTIVQEIIKLHGGKINVNSTLGEGTTFELVIPYRK
ncbi:sensor histidine kinase [Thermosipho africanus Ob7]|uniref:histidine kinase n=1 Tax=Thermosipho africanus (strain TCF52B) TaxID=484019 RepID=B7IDY9_THEAB|nr:MULTISPECIES: ATP-binding protein [Thermosipho]ACJ76216.1 sensor histidine kinase [Thermosipho africanus TCF52B]RDI92017.1 sensor histidine kinase [Thermosipho africanus Ob7]